MGSIKLNSIEKWFDELQVIKGIDLEIMDGEFVILVGPSGCGKSTLSENDWRFGRNLSWLYYSRW